MKMFEYDNDLILNGHTIRAFYRNMGIQAKTVAFDSFNATITEKGMALPQLTEFPTSDNRTIIWEKMGMSKISLHNNSTAAKLSRFRI
jgi:hypothetical protein